MTKEETVRIMAMLGAFYGGGKTDPKAQASAWHAILQKYDYKIAERAVLNFAENDVRDYATFPAVGKIVQAIKSEVATINAPINQIIRNIAYGRAYSLLSDNAKNLISEEKYDEWLQMDAEEFSSVSGALQSELRGEQLRLEVKK